MCHFNGSWINTIHLASTSNWIEHAWVLGHTVITVVAYNSHNMSGMRKCTLTSTRWSNRTTTNTPTKIGNGSHNGSKGTVGGRIERS